MSSKTAEVRTLTALYVENRSLNINPFSMLLSGLIDAAVGGGIKNYRIVFFNDKYTAGNPGDEQRVKKLKQLIEEQVCGYQCLCMRVCVYGCMRVCVWLNGGLCVWLYEGLYVWLNEGLCMAEWGSVCMAEWGSVGMAV